MSCETSSGILPYYGIVAGETGSEKYQWSYDGMTNRTFFFSPLRALYTFFLQLLSISNEIFVHEPFFLFTVVRPVE